MQIQSDIPPPVQSSGRREKYPFPRMKIGDSVFVRNGTIPGASYRAAMSYGRRSQKQFTGRKVEGGIRIWRVE